MTTPPESANVDAQILFNEDIERQYLVLGSIYWFLFLAGSLVMLMSSTQGADQLTY